jgi:DNA-binding NarL/FixJ family response regulator
MTKSHQSAKGDHEHVSQLSFFVIHHQHTVLDLLAEALSTQPRCGVAGKSRSLEQALQQIITLKPDYLLMNIEASFLTERRQGLLETMHAKVPDVRVIGLTDYDHDADSIPNLHAICSMSAPLWSLRVIISEMLNRDYPSTTSPVNANVVKGPSKLEHEMLKQITIREREVIRLIACSHSNKEVARRLGLSTKTVENHRANLKRKIDGKDTASIVRFAVRTGLISLSR